MSEQAIVIDSFEFARNREVLHGNIPVASCSRLQEALSSDEGELEYALSGGIDARGKPCLRITVKGALHLVCQRCLGPLDYPLDAVSHVVLARDESELSSLDEESGETAEAIVAEPELDVLALVEDEVLLNIPISPMHADPECKVGQDAGQADARAGGAFAALAALKGTKPS